MYYYRHVAKALAESFLSGSETVDGFEERAVKAMGKNYAWLRPLCVKIRGHFNGGLSRANTEAIADFILADEGFAKAFYKNRKEKPKIRFHFANEVRMDSPHPAIAGCEIPQLPTPGSICDWLNIGVRELEWYAGGWNCEQRAPEGPLRHYTYRWVPKPNATPRLIEIPKHRLRAIQRRILNEILNEIPAHHTAHGFAKGRSCLTFCRPHVNKRVVLRVDLRDFFPRIHQGRIIALFRAMGYPVETAKKLAGLCTNRVPGDVVAAVPHKPGDLRLSWRERKKYQSPHLPQGAPTSPAIANLCAFRLDRRLKGAAVKAGAVYTRYADDMAFSGGKDFEREVNRFYIFVYRIAIEEGFEINTRKTRIMRRGVRQKLAGIVLNRHPNIARREYDALRAMLYNCVRLGPSSQNRGNIVDFRAHLLGRISYMRMINPKRARRLIKLFEQIRWE